MEFAISSYNWDTTNIFWRIGGYAYILSYSFCEPFSFFMVCVDPTIETAKNIEGVNVAAFIFT